jgi:Ca2+-binding EF-hand superfamily protein
MQFEGLNFEVPEQTGALVPEGRLLALIEIFSKLDQNRDGKVGLGEFLDFYLAEKKEQLRRKFQRYDQNQDGTIEFEEFVTMMEPNYSILKRFRELDLDKNGLLSMEEALNIAECLVLPMSREQTKALIQTTDQDLDGHVTYYEFLEAVSHLGFQ